ncbi:MAG: helix-turn-helix domain-containing protein [Amphiplicatus sp.]
MDQAQILEIVAASMAIAVTTFGAAALALRDGPRRDQAFFLAAFLLLCDLGKLDHLGHLLGLYVFAPFMAVVIFPAKMLLGPAIYYYARSMTTTAPQSLSRRDAWAFVGPAAALVIASQFLFLNAPEKIALVSGDKADPALREWALLNCALLFALFLGICLAYLAAAFRLFLRHTRRVQDLFSNIEDKSLAWLRSVLIILVVGWASQVIGEVWAIEGGRPVWHRVTTTYFDLGWICAIALFGILQRPVFDGRRAEGGTASGDAKYARSALSGERMAKIAAKLDRAMTCDRLYENPTLSLRALSDRLGVSENHLSQTFSKRLGVNFFDFVNGARIAEARRRLAATSDSVLTIAHAVGFNSRSTFNAAFKKHAGTTPRQYRQAARSIENPLVATSLS